MRRNTLSRTAHQLFAKRTNSRLLVALHDARCPDADLRQPLDDALHELRAPTPEVLQALGIDDDRLPTTVVLLNDDLVALALLTVELGCKTGLLSHKQLGELSDRLGESLGLLYQQS